MATIDTGLITGVIGGVTALFTVWVGFKKNRTESIESYTQVLRQDMKELKETNKELTSQVQKMLILFQEINLELKQATGKDFSNKVSEIVEGKNETNY